MNKTVLIFLLAMLTSPCLIAQTTDGQAPLVKLDVLINGKKYRVTDGKSIIVDGDTITVKTSEVVTFNFGALIFDYPKHFAFAFEEDFGYKNWMLDGNDYVITYFEFDAEVDLDVIIGEMVKQFGRKNCKVVDSKITLGNLDMIGKRIDVDLLGSKLTYEMFRVEADDFKTHFLTFQDTKNEDGTNSEEGIRTLEIINETIELK